VWERRSGRILAAILPSALAWEVTTRQTFGNGTITPSPLGETRNAPSPGAVSPFKGPMPGHRTKRKGENEREQDKDRPLGFAQPADPKAHHQGPQESEGSWAGLDGRQTGHPPVSRGEVVAWAARRGEFRRRETGILYCSCTAGASPSCLAGVAPVIYLLRATTTALPSVLRTSAPSRRASNPPPAL
jgi:hypothetical protein